MATTQTTTDGPVRTKENPSEMESKGKRDRAARHGRGIKIKGNSDRRTGLKSQRFDTVAGKPHGSGSRRAERARGTGQTDSKAGRPARDGQAQPGIGRAKAGYAGRKPPIFDSFSRTWSVDWNLSTELPHCENFEEGGDALVWKAWAYLAGLTALKYQLPMVLVGGTAYDARFLNHAAKRFRLDLLLYATKAAIPGERDVWRYVKELPTERLIITPPTPNGKISGKSDVWVEFWGMDDKPFNIGESRLVKSGEVYSATQRTGMGLAPGIRLDGKENELVMILDRQAQEETPTRAAQPFTSVRIRCQRGGFDWSQIRLPPPKGKEPIPTPPAFTTLRESPPALVLPPPFLKPPPAPVATPPALKAVKSPSMVSPHPYRLPPPAGDQAAGASNGAGHTFSPHLELLYSVADDPLFPGTPAPQLLHSPTAGAQSEASQAKAPPSPPPPPSPAAQDVGEADLIDVGGSCDPLNDQSDEEGDQAGVSIEMDDEEEGEGEADPFIPPRDGNMRNVPEDVEPPSVFDAMVGHLAYGARYVRQPTAVLNALMCRITPGDSQTDIYDAMRSVSRSLGEPMDGVARVLKDNLSGIQFNWDAAGSVSNHLWNPWDMIWWDRLGKQNSIPLILLSVLWLWALGFSTLFIAVVCLLLALPTILSGGPVRGRHVVWTMLVLSVLVLGQIAHWESQAFEGSTQRSGRGVRGALKEDFIDPLRDWGRESITPQLIMATFTFERLLLACAVFGILYILARRQVVRSRAGSFCKNVYLAAVIETILENSVPYFAVVFAALDILDDFCVPLFVEHLTIHAVFALAPFPLALVLHLLWNYLAERPAGRSTTLAYDLLHPSAEPGLHIEPICTEFLPLKQPRPGAHVQPPPIAPCFMRGKGGYYLAGPRISTARVYNYRGCGHNMMRAAVHRMAGVGKRYAGVDFVRETEAVEAAWRQREAAVTEWLRSTRDNCGFLDRPPVRRLTVEKWLRRYPAGQREKMRLSWLASRGRGLRDDYGSFVKKEKTTVVTDYDEFSCPHDYIGCHAFTDKVPDPRGISCPPEAFRVEVGPDCDYYNSRLQTFLNGRVLYAIGISSPQLGEWVEHAMYRWPWAVAVCGDDTLVFRWVNGKVVVSSLDISRFDMHIHRAALETSWDWMKRFGLSHLASVLRRQASPRRYRIRTSEGFGRLRVYGTRASGDGDTISSNTLVAIYPALSALLNGEDIRQVYWDCGFVVTGKDVDWQWGECDYDFLQRIMLPTDEQKLRPTPKPGRILTRAFWSQTPLRPDRRLEYCRAVVDSIRGDVMHCPLLNDLVRRIDQLYPKAPRIKLPREYREDHRLLAGKAAVEHPAAELWLARRYDLWVEDIKEMRERIRRWEPGDFLDDLATRDAFKRVAEVDLM